MVLSTHQPIFLPWPGFFFKAMHADCLVLLDEVQFPRGRGWMSRNRIKSEQGELWLTVPVYRKGRSLQSICDVEIAYETEWLRKHEKGMEQNYIHAPYFSEFFPEIRAIYRKNHRKLVSLNVELIRLMWNALSFKKRILLQSDLEIAGKGTDLLIAICKKLHAKEYLAFKAAEKYLDRDMLANHGIALKFIDFYPPVYPQMWGDFIYNLSTLDLLLNCGPKSRDIISGK
jgi:hypothetical protein